MKRGEPHGPYLIVWDEYTIISHEMWDQLVGSKFGREVRKPYSVIKGVIADPSSDDPSRK